MKKLILSLALVSSSAFAGPHGHYHSNVGAQQMWPVIIAGTIGYYAGKEMNRPPVVVQQAPVIVQPPVYNNSPGVYNLPTPAPTYGATPIYERRSQYDPACNCYVMIYNQIGWQ